MASLGQKLRRASFALAALTLTAEPTLGSETFHQFEEPRLKAGGEVWHGTCINCHATGFASAPPVTDFSMWEARIAQDKETLYEHALEGFYGEEYAYMPPRGGNEKLSDEEVQMAVDYMVALVKHLAEQ